MKIKETTEPKFVPTPPLTTKAWTDNNNLQTSTNKTLNSNSIFNTNKNISSDINEANSLFT